jgi:F-box/TPR repeat protein Pof3
VNISTDYLLLEALDKRAATHVKMNELQLALRDAKKMIELKPSLSKVNILAVIRR